MGKFRRCLDICGQIFALLRQRWLTRPQPTVRRYAETLPAGQTGWLAGLREPQVAKTLALLNGHVSRRWTVDELGNTSASLSQVAETVGYDSEAAFSRAFKGVRPRAGRVATGQAVGCAAHLSAL
jgi:hypothetical protein